MSIVMSVNAGSSSLKFQVFDMPSEKVLVKGLVERIGLNDAIFSIKVGDEKFETVTEIPNHTRAVELLIDALLEHNIVHSLEEIEAVGHRMVHGGEFYSESVVATPDAEEKFEECIPLAPLHNPLDWSDIVLLRKRFQTPRIHLCLIQLSIKRCRKKITFIRSHTNIMKMIIFAVMVCTVQVINIY